MNKYNSCMIERVIYEVEKIVWGPQFLGIFIILGIYLSIKLKLPQLKTLGIVTKMNGKQKGDISSFKALMTILAGTLGVGNIIGVATAISVGGIGSIFWIFVSGILAMPISYAENYLVLKYRKRDKQKGFFGGAMYVLGEVMDKKWLAVLFALFTLIATIGMGAMVQPNSVTDIIFEETQLSKTVIAVVIAIISSYIIFGGKHKMAKLNGYVIPFCTLIYITLCSMIIVNNISRVPTAIKSICKEAFGIKEISGGIIGSGVIYCMSIGFSRGMFSNEAGMGSAPIFAATAEDVENINTSAHIMAYSVFVDTLLLCVLTGVTLVVAGAGNISNTAVMLDMAFGTLPFGNLLLIFCITVFAVATIPCWEFYGEQAMWYLFRREAPIQIYKIIYIICVYVGCVLELDIVWSISNISNAIMAIPNLYMIFMLRREIQS